MGQMFSTRTRSEKEKELEKRLVMRTYRTSGSSTSTKVKELRKTEEKATSRKKMEQKKSMGSIYKVWGDSGKESLARYQKITCGVGNETGKFIEIWGW